MNVIIIKISEVLPQPIFDLEKETYTRAVISGGAGGILTTPEFGSSVNPIPTGGADYAHHITASTPDSKTYRHLCFLK